MLVEHTSQATQSQLPSANQLFHDHLNDLLYVVRGSQLYEQDLRKKTQRDIHIAAIEEGSDRDRPDIPKMVARTNGSKASEGHVSPSGLYIVNGDQEEIYMSTVGYSKGIHFWQFHCPISLFGVTFGIATKTGSDFKEEMFEFTSSTSRTVSFKIDFSLKKIHAWINGTTPVRTPFLTVPEGIWYPCVRIKGKGIPVVFNPFALDPERYFSAYNPFNTSVLALSFPKIEPTAGPSRHQNKENLHIIPLNQDQFCLYTDSRLAKIITRSTTTNRFEFDWFARPTRPDSPVEISFNLDDINQLNQYLNQSGLSPLESNRIHQDSICVQASLEGWFNFFKYTLTYIQNDKASPVFAQVLLEKLQKIRPFLHILDEQIQPYLYSGYNRLAEWRQPKQHRFFEDAQYDFVTSTSDVSNNFGALRLPDGIIGSSENYIAAANGTVVSIYNTQLGLHLLATLCLDRMTNKQQQLKQINELMLGNLTSDIDGPSIFKILRNCMKEDKKQVNKDKKPQASPNAKFLKILQEDFKFSRQEAVDALINTNNESVDEAIAYIIEKRVPSKPKDALWICSQCTLQNQPTSDICVACDAERNSACQIVEQNKQAKHYDDIIGLGISETNNCLAPLLLTVRHSSATRLLLVGPHPEQVNKFIFKLDQGYVSYVDFRYISSPSDIDVAAVSYQDHYFGNGTVPAWICLEETGLQASDKIQMDGLALYSYNGDGVVKNQIKIDYNKVYLTDRAMQVQQGTKEERPPKKKAQMCPESQRIEFNLEYVSQGGNDVVDAEVLNDVPEGEEYIPLLVQQGPPGCNMNYPICSILYPMNKSFLANYPYQLVFKHLHGKSLQVSCIVIEKIGQNKNVKEVKEGLVWLTDSLTSQPSLRYKFRFAPESKRTVLRVPFYVPKQYLFILPIFEEGSDPNIPFEIGFVGATTRKQPIMPTHNIQGLLSQRSVGDFLEIRQSGKIIEPEGMFEITKDRFLRVSAKIPTDKPYRVTIKKPFRLLSSNAIKDAVESKPQVKEGVEVFAEDSPNAHIVFEHLSEHQISHLNEKGILLILNWLFHSVKKPEEEPKRQAIQRVVGQMRKSSEGRYVNEVIASYINNLGLRTVSSLTNLDYLLSLNIVSEHELHKILDEVIKTVNLQKNYHYSGLRQKQKLSHLLYEPEFFSDYYYNLVQKTLTKKKQSIYPLQKIQSRFVQIKEKYIRTLIVDLEKMTAVKYLLLAFQKSDLRAKMRINIFTSDRELVSSSFYQDHCWLQLTKNAYSKGMKKLFADPIASGLNCLGIKLATKTRYLIIEISHTLLPAMGEAAEDDNLPFIEIVPEVFGKEEKEAEIVPELAKYFIVPKQNTHFLSTLNINSTQYEKSVVNANSKQYYIYDRTKNDADDNISVDKATAKHTIGSLQASSDWDGLIKFHKSLVGISRGNIGLDYYYTLVIKILEHHQGQLPQELAESLFQTFVVNEIGPISSIVLKKIIQNPKMYVKALPYLNDENYTVFQQEKLSEKDVKQYVKTVQQGEPSLKTLLKLLKNQQNSEQWLEQMIFVAQQANRDEEVGDMLTHCNWRQKQSAKKYLIHLSQTKPEELKKIIRNLDSKSVVRHYIDISNSKQHEERQYSERLLSIINSMELPKENDVLQNFVRELLRHIKEHKDSDQVSQSIWIALMAACKSDLPEKTHLEVLQNLLKQTPEIKLQFVGLAETIVEKQQKAAPNTIISYLFGHGLHFSLTTDTYLDLLLRKQVKLEPRIVGYLAKEVGEYLMKLCNIGGTEGAKCSSQIQLIQLVWASKILDLIIEASEEPLIGTVKQTQWLDNLIRWYLLNNTHDLNPTNPAYRAPSFNLILAIQKKIESILKASKDNNQKTLKRIFENFNILNDKIKKNGKILQSARHILAYRLHHGTNHLFNVLSKGHPDILADFMCDSHFFESLVKTLKEETPSQKAKAVLGYEQDLTTNFEIVVSADETKPEIKDWTANKAGNSKSGLMNIKLANPVLTLSSPQPVSISSIIIGFLAIDNPEKSNIHPLSVSCWAGDDLNNLMIIGTMDLIDDQHLASCLTKTFGLNLNKLKPAHDKQNIFDTIYNKKFKYVQFRLRKPNLPSVADIFQGYQKSTSSYYTLSFVSLNGYEEPTESPSFVQTHLKLLQLLSRPTFHDTLNSLIEKDFFKKKFNDTISAIVRWINIPEYTKLISTLLISISEHSKDLGNQIIDGFFMENRNEMTGQLLFELITKNTRLAGERLVKYYEHLINSLKNINNGSASQYATDFKTFVEALEVSSMNIQKLGLQELTLKLTMEDAQNMYKLFISVPAIRPALAEFFTAIVQNREGVKSDKGLLLSLVQDVWGKPNRLDLYTLFSAVIPTDDPSITWFIQSGMLNELINELVGRMSAGLKIYECINLLDSLSSNTLINQQINKNLRQLDIFRTLSDTKNEKHLLKQIGKESMAHIVNFFKQSCIDTEAQVPFAKMLKDILTDLPSKFSTDFIYDFFIPLVNSYKSVSIVMIPVDRQTNMYIDKPNRIVGKCPVRANNNLIDLQQRFSKAEVKKLPRTFSGIWSVAEKQQAIQNGFVAKNHAVLIEHDGPNKILIYRSDENVITTVVNDRHEHHTYVEGFTSLKVGDFDISGDSSDLKINGLDNPTFKFYKVQHDEKQSDLLTNELLLNMERPILLDSKYINSYSPKNNLTRQHIYFVPSELKVGDLVKHINLGGIKLNSIAEERFSLRFKGKQLVDRTKTFEELAFEHQRHGILYLEYDAQGLFEHTSIISIQEEMKQERPEIMTSVGLFRSFEKQGGVEKIIQVVIESVKLWKNEKVAKRWLQYMQELKSFSSFPYFFSLFMKNKQNVELLFNLLAALPDKDDEKKWEAKEKQSVKDLYKNVSEVFVVDNTAKIREFALSNNFFEMMLERLQIISKEPKRQLKEEEENLPEAPTMNKQTSEDDNKRRKKAKKGIGYGTDSSTNQKWDIAETELTKKQINQQIINIVEILDKFLDFKDWAPPKSLLQSIYASALLPIIESALRGGSLLEIGKDSEVYKAYLHLIDTISKHQSLIPCLLNIPAKYLPKQTESVYGLLMQLKGTSEIFLSCLPPNTDEENKASQEIARLIVSTYAKVEEEIERYNLNKQEDNDESQRILEMPLTQKYKILLKDLRFDYISMKDNSGKFKHHYSSSYTASYTPPMTKTIRLAQQLADISTALPVEHTNAIFVRCDKERVDFMQALIMGSNGTPYGHGAYLFDIYFEDTYPNVSPKVNLTTTGHGKVRFNPNLYACGKVCLSLLGTWRGNATENWDPKVSTLLQVLVSIQSIIMAEEVYFNEPGFQHEQGTEEGDRKNEAYSNIVRYCNIKYAMTENIKNPPKGFETIIRRHFYLKKDEILEECQRWVKYASKRQASYNGLISDHNNNWSTEFKKTKTKYKEMLEEAIKQLEQELNKLPAPSSKDLIKTDKSPIKGKKQDKNIDADTNTGLNLDQVDVTYNSGPQGQKQLDFNDQKVKDRWSRYIGAMGIDAVSRQAKANVAVFGLGPLAIEIVKNIVLSGCRKVTLIDEATVSWRDLSGQFFLSESDIGKNRVESCIHKIKELNLYVKIDRMPYDLTELSKLKEYTVILATELPYSDQVKIDAFCRENNICFISADCFGPYSRLYNDFGENFEVLDKNGEDPVEVMIESITNAEKGVVTLLKNSKHPYEDGDVITISGVDGMKGIESQKSINGSIHKIKVINSRSFEIGDTRGYGEYIKNGLAKNIKIPTKISFPSFVDAVTKKQDPPVDGNMAISDFSKLAHNNLMHFCFIALDMFREKERRVPNPWSHNDSSAFIELYKSVDTSEFTTENEKFVRRFSYTCSGTFSPLCAFFGGYVAQQIVKAITKKYMPTNCIFLCDFVNVVPTLPEDVKEWAKTVEDMKFQEKKERTDGLKIVVGEQLLKEIEKCRLFMIGSGAIGCQLLKNYAMLNLGTAKETPTSKQGLIVLTDPDLIEVSNLNRQFLFRQKHIRKPKSTTAAASVIQMNPNMKGHISARLDKISDATKNIYTDEFFQDKTIITNALDNIVARRYVDSRCVQNKVPLLESGTLGPKGHVQVIIPYETESYGSKEDPAEDGQIPHCTLKMFPEETLHCVEWARDKFGSKFSLKPKALIKILEGQESDKAETQEIKVLKSCLKLLRNHPVNFEDCIHYAINKFYKYFRNDIKQLIYTYPLDAKTKDGQPFWKLPKRPPTAIEQFDENNELHCTFVTALAVMVAKIHNIPYPSNFRTAEGRKEVGETASIYKIEPFVPSDQKAKQIADELSKEKKEEGAKEMQPEPVVDKDQNQEELLRQIYEIAKQKNVKFTAEEFEKDCDENGHIDLIYSLANLRALNYSLDKMDWLTTKLKAGRIVPALSTTTTSIAGLQTYELVKYLKKVKVDQMRNAFLNLAVPIMQLSEPGQVQKIKLTEDLTVTIWERWEVSCNRNIKLGELFGKLQQKYKIKPRDVIYGSTPIFLAATMDIEAKKAEREAALNRQLMDSLALDESTAFVDLLITFSKLEGGDLLSNTPIVRVTFLESEPEKVEIAPKNAGAAPGAQQKSDSSYDSDNEEEVSEEV